MHHYPAEELVWCVSFEDETIGVKVGPTLVVFFAVMLVIVVIVAHLSVQLGFFG